MPFLCKYSVQNVVMIHVIASVCAVTWFLIFTLYLTVWGVEPVVTHRTSWLETTGVCGVRQNRAWWEF